MVVYLKMQFTKQVSMEYLKKIFCKNATTFTFEKYVKNLK